jgi:hypothetical protein
MSMSSRTIQSRPSVMLPQLSQRPAGRRFSWVSPDAAALLFARAAAVAGSSSEDAAGVASVVLSLLPAAA